VNRRLREAVLERDRYCFGLRVDPSHACRDQFGRLHPAGDLSRLTVDHVHPHAGGTKGKRAPDSMRTLVAMCWGMNVGVPSREVRQAERAYLAMVEG
jgi:hypothetical protein